MEKTISLHVIIKIIFACVSGNIDRIVGTQNVSSRLNFLLFRILYNFVNFTLLSGFAGRNWFGQLRTRLPSLHRGTSVLCITTSDIWICHFPYNNTSCRVALSRLELNKGVLTSNTPSAL